MKPSEWFQANITNDHPDEQSREMERKILRLLEAVEKAKFEAIYPDYATDPHGVEMGHYGCVPATSAPYIDCDNDQPILRAAYALREK